MLYCQQGQSKLANDTLSELGYNVKLSSSIWNHKAKSNNNNKKATTTTNTKLTKKDKQQQKEKQKGKVALFDDVLSPRLLERLCTIFKPDGAFLSQHDYYNEGGNSTSSSSSKKNKGDIIINDNDIKNSCIINQVVDEILPLIKKQFSEKFKNTPCTSVEFWSHSRSQTESHQLHFDLGILFF
eukprot:Awhi_evm1s14303